MYLTDVNHNKVLSIPVVLNVNNATAHKLDQQNRPVLCQAVVPLDCVKHVSNLKQHLT